MGRSVAAVAIGVLAGALLVFFTEMLGHAIYPPPADIDLKDPEALAAALPRLPFEAKAFVVLGWFVGAVGGAYAALRGARRWAPAAWVVAGVMFCMTVLTLISLPHPWWRTLAAPVASGAGGWLAVRLGNGTYASPIADDKSAGLFE
ncbi:MAG: hypothetical protein ACFB00_03640 [Parvularculaceae bacterium]